jgi:hypothetical protein
VVGANFAGKAPSHSEVQVEAGAFHEALTVQISLRGKQALC